MGLSEADIRGLGQAVRQEKENRRRHTLVFASSKLQGDPAEQVRGTLAEIGYLL